MRGRTIGAAHPLPNISQDWLDLPLESLFARLHADAKGLSSSEAAARLTQYGPNVVAGRERRSPLIDFLRRFLNPLVLVLLVAAAISAATGNPTSFIIIITMVVLSVTLDFVQEYRAKNAAEKLRASVAIHVRVLRDGVPADLAAQQIVPGDIVTLAAGDLVPADCRLIEAKDLFLNEALLTGEPYPVEKHAGGRAVEGRQIAVTTAMMGSSVVSGTAKAVVVTTGRGTQLGGIAGALRREPPPTAFAAGLHDFGLLIVRVTVLLALFTLLINLMLARPVLESFLFALALAVGLTPELLPMVVSVTLAHGALRMAKKQVIVKRLSAIHDLGSMDVLCSDKTGTLTEACVAVAGQIDLTGAKAENILPFAYVNAAYETGLKSPLDEAIMRSAKIDLAAWRKLDEVPFDFERRRVSVLVENAGKRLLIVKGAPEDVLKLSARYQSAQGALAALDEHAEGTAKAILNRLGSDGLRALGVGWREMPPDCARIDVNDERELVFAGFATFFDPPKQSARQAIAELTGLGVSVRILSGDNEHVTQHVCRELGMAVSGVLTGTELTGLGEEALSARLKDVNLFCRVTPAQKLRIISALRRQGHVVGYVGDGINDAPSLHEADVGLSVDGAVDVAQEAAAMILLQKDLGVLAEGVREGRRTFANIMKYVMMGTSSNFGNMFSMAGGVLFLPFLPMLPIQILFNNLLYDLSEIPIPMDEVDEAMVVRPQHWDMRFVRNFMLVLGPVSSLFDFLTFGLLLWVFRAGEALFHTGWFVESLATQILVIFLIRTRGSPLKSRPHPLLAGTSLSIVAAAVLLPYTPLGNWFGFTPLPGLLLAAIFGMTAVYLVLVEYVKRWFYRRFAPA